MCTPRTLKNVYVLKNEMDSFVLERIQKGILGVALRVTSFKVLIKISKIHLKINLI